MKISFNPSVSYANTKKSINNEKQAVTNTNQYNEIQKNSLAELIGRSQTVSFGAINKSQGSIFEHTCQERFGFGEKDVITYNKKNGSLKHEIYGSDGNVRKIEEFFPADSSEILTVFNDNGIKTVRTTTPTFSSFEKYDPEGREIYFKHDDSDGSLYTRETDYRRQRCVHREQKTPYHPENITVIDLRTNKSVTSGKLVVDKRFDKQSNTYITENIVTKQVLETEQRMPNGSLLRLVSYVEGSGLVKREIDLNQQTGGYCERIYSGQGQNNLVKLINTSRDERKEHVIEYGADGKTIRSNVLYTKNRNKDIDSATVYVGKTTKIDFKENYYDGYYTRTTYNNTPNVPRCEDTFNSEDKSLITRIIFYDDGKRKYQVEEYNEDDSFSRTTLNHRGKTVKVEYIEANGFLSSVEEYDGRTGRITKLSQFEESGGYSTITSYNIETGNADKTERYNGRNELEEQIEFYENGKTPKRRKNFNFDGSYKEINYNPDGTIQNQAEFDKYGRKKFYSNSANQNWNYQQRTENSTQAAKQTTGAKTDVESDFAFMDRINNIISKSTERNGRVISLFSKSDLSNYDWDRLSKLVNVSDVQVIKNMDKATYRTLSKQFHPDLNLNKSQEEQIRAEKLFQIIKGIYTQ